MQQSFEVELHPSRQLCIGLGLGHGLAALAVAWAGLSAWVSVVLLLVIDVSWGVYFQQHGLGNGLRSIRGLRLTEQGWEISAANGIWWPASLVDSICHRWLVLMTLKTSTGRRTVLICPDSAKPEAQRRLRLLLSTSGASGDGEMD